MLEDIGERASPPAVKIYSATTYFKFTISENYKIGCNLSIANFIKRNLVEMEWNPRYNKYLIMASYCIRDKDGYCRMPAGFLHPFCKFLQESGCKYEVIDHTNLYEPRTIQINKKRNVELRNDQIPIFNFLTNNSLAYKPVSAQVGSGKTVISIIAFTSLKYAVLIVLNGLISQWYKSLFKFTNLKKEDVYVIQGFDSIKDLWEMFNNGYRPKVIIAAARTTYMWIYEKEGPYTELPSFEEFQKQFGIGVAMHDEVHMNFCTNTKIDLFINTPHNIYLSATYIRNNPQSKRIFNTIFPISKVFGAVGGDIKKYTKAIVGQYSLYLDEKQRAKCMTQKGYSHALYESIILKSGEAKRIFFSNIIKPLVDIYYIKEAKPKQKLLILCLSRDMCEHLCDYLKTVYSKYKVTLYFSGSKGSEGNDTNLTKDIIISTNKSCGTGRDIPGLKTCISTISYSSIPLAIQVFGRLRQIPNEETIFVDMWNKDISAHYRHYRDRLLIYKDRATSVIETTFN